MRVSPALEVSRAARPAIERMTPGEIAVIPLPDSHLRWRSATESVSRLVHRTLGAGNYSVDTKSAPGHLRVTFHARKRTADGASS